jgi:uncharacterized protein (DUF111 family)
MRHKVRVIKRGDRHELELDRLEQHGPHPTREIKATIKLWVSEFKQRRRSDEQYLRLARAEETLHKSVRCHVAMTEFGGTEKV